MSTGTRPPDRAPEPAAEGGAQEPAPGRGPAGERRRVRMVPGGPVLVEGPVEVVLEDGSTVVSERWLVALCACRRSRSYPFCDTSHRRRTRG
ncbi:Iron-binding zinc finger CDGSH type [Actinomadura meyerae]|uniref:Iron-binding zinc finger CDGSH type n=1 Tax=Actinomadura meyerae TaxID=240840 RepID=A0A239ISL4_9ACTN|nr:Iron-binding zinc finger CDGSH type [Actinomadura meyerae]